MRNAPPIVDSARARNPSGTASIMKPCREIRNMLYAAPLTATAAASPTTDPVSAPATIATASSSPASTSAVRSPTRATTAPEGSEASSMPTPSIATTRAAVPTSAPSSRARSAVTGSTAPWPIETTSVGPYGDERDVAQPERLGRGGHRHILRAAATGPPIPPRAGSPAAYSGARATRRTPATPQENPMLLTGRLAARTAGLAALGLVATLSAAAPGAAANDWGTLDDL